MHVCTCGSRRVSESSVCPSARLCEDPLQWKRGHPSISPRGSVPSMRGGKPEKVSLFNEAMTLHEAGVDGIVHEVVGMYRARWMV